MYVVVCVGVCVCVCKIILKIWCRCNTICLISCDILPSCHHHYCECVILQDAKTFDMAAVSSSFPFSDAVWTCGKRDR